MRQTKKLKRANGKLFDLGLPLEGTHDQRYKQLQEANYWWDGERWAKGAKAQPASPLIRVRVWAKSQIVEDVARAIVADLASSLDLIEQSKAYQNRPPNQLESRVYLTFLPANGVKRR